MRALLPVGAACLASAGCIDAYAVVATIPAAAPIAVVAAGGGGQFSMTGGSLGGDGDVPGGWSADARVSTYAYGLSGGTRIQVGKFGEDGRFGMIGTDLGVGHGNGVAFGGLTLGYTYGGHVQTGHQIPLRLTAAVGTPWGAARLGGYAGWRFRIAGEAPGAATRHGLGWNAFGAEAWLLLGPPQTSFAIGITWDRADDVDAMSVQFGAGVHKPAGR